MKDPGVVTQLDDKYGIRDYELPGFLPENLSGVVTLETGNLKRLYNGIKPLDPCGYRNEYLRCLSGSMSDKDAADVVKEHAEFGTQYVNDQLSKWYYYVCTTTSMIAFIKQATTTPTGTPSVRPIGMGGCKRISWTSLLMEENADVFRRTFWCKWLWE